MSLVQVIAVTAGFVGAFVLGCCFGKLFTEAEELQEIKEEQAELDQQHKLVLRRIEAFESATDDMEHTMRDLAVALLRREEFSEDFVREQFDKLGKMIREAKVNEVPEMRS